MGAFRREKGVNVTDIYVTYHPPGQRDRAVCLVVLRPGVFPTPEAQVALEKFWDGVKAVQALYPT